MRRMQLSIEALAPALALAPVLALAPAPAPALTLLTRQAHALAAALLSPEELDSTRGCPERALVQVRLGPNPSPTLARP